MSARKRTPTEFSFVFVVLIFFVSGLFSWNLYFKVYRQSDTVDIASFPKEIGDWTSKDLPLTPTEIAILETDNLFVRQYTHKDGRHVFLFIVYSQNNRKVSHPPEVCYTGAGIDIVNSSRDAIITADHKFNIPVNQFTVEGRNLQQSVFYWFKIGDSFTPNYWKQQALIAVKTFLGKPSSSAMIRISTPIKNDDETQARKVMKEFGQLIIPYMYIHLP